MKTCYAIVSGSYSDYSVLAVATDRPTAEAWAKAVRDNKESRRSDASVEEMMLLEPDEPVRTYHRVALYEEWWDDGTTTAYRLNETDELPIDMLYGIPPSRPSVRFVRAPMHANKGGRIEIYGRTRKAVLKVYSEQKAMWQAEPRAFKRG